MGKEVTALEATPMRKVLLHSWRQTFSSVRSASSAVKSHGSVEDETAGRAITQGRLRFSLPMNLVRQPCEFLIRTDQKFAATEDGPAGQFGGSRVKGFRESASIRFRDRPRAEVLDWPAAGRAARFRPVMFQKGQKVVCINDDFPSPARKLYVQLPKKDSVYTVRAVYIGRGNYTAAGSGRMEGEIGVLLEEIRNPTDPSLKAGLSGELGFNSERFAPLQYNTDTEERETWQEKPDADLVPA